MAKSYGKRSFVGKGFFTIGNLKQNMVIIFFLIFKVIYICYKS